MSSLLTLALANGELVWLCLFCPSYPADKVEQRPQYFGIIVEGEFVAVFLQTHCCRVVVRHTWNTVTSDFVYVPTFSTQVCGDDS